MPVCIEIADLTKRYGSVVAVDALSLSVEEGEVFGLLGPNGAGKSTTLNILTGLARPTSGSISVFNTDLRRNALEIRSRTGVLLEKPAFYDHLTARRNLWLQARIAQRNVTIDRALDLVNLLHVASQKVRTFSQGMRQRLALAQALLTEPELLVLDEPTAGLDVESTREVLRLLRFLADEAKVTIVFTSHMLHEVESLCDRVAVLNKGKLVDCSHVDTLLSYDPSIVNVLLDAPEAAAKRLIKETWVDDAVADKGGVSVRLDGGNVHQLTSFLLSKGYVIHGVIPRRRTLQDYFMKVLNP